MVFSFFKTRKARAFNHKLIYWNPREEALQKRVERIKRELGIKDDLDNRSEVNNEKNTDSEDDLRERLSQAIYSKAQHMKNVQAKGFNKKARKDKVIQLLIIIIALFGIFWYLYS